MIVEKEKIEEAKLKIGAEKTWDTMKRVYGLTNTDDRNHKACCPFHNEKTPSFILNEKTMKCRCFGCSRNADIIDAYMYEGKTYMQALEELFKEANMRVSFGEVGVKTKRDYKYPHPDDCGSKDIIYEYLAKRKISKETVDKAGLTQDDKGNIVFNYYDTNDVLTMCKYRPSHKIIKGKENKNWCQYGADTTPLLFNMNKVNASLPLICCEGECVLGDTEVLTPTGWVRLDAYNNEMVLQIHPDMTGSFVTPLAYVKHEYDGDMYSEWKKNYSIEVTANHNMVYLDKDGAPYKKKACEARYGRDATVPTVTHVNGTGIPLNNEQIALYLAVSADCTIDVRKSGIRYSRFSVKKTRKYQRIKSILNSLNIEYFDNPKTPDGYYYIGFRTPVWLESKLLPMEWLGSATEEQRRFIIEEMVHWDGNTVPNRAQYEYSSKEYHNAVFMQTIAHTCGYHATIIRRHNAHGSWYKVAVLLKKNHVSHQKPYHVEHYNGMVYCVTVPTGMILVRHHEHISVTGNCDTLAAIEAGFPNAVSVPFGSQNTQWIEHNWDWLEQFSEIIICSDNDEAGVKMRKEVIPRLGAWRTKYIDIPKVHHDEATGKDYPMKDLNEVLFYEGKEGVRKLFDSACDPGVPSVTNVSDIHDMDLDEVDGVTTGISEIDRDLMRLFYGTLTILSGKAGGGKTSFLSQVFCHAMDEGKPVWMFSREMPDWMQKNWFNYILAGGHHITVQKTSTGTEYYKVANDAKEAIDKYYNNQWFLYRDEWSNKIDDVLASMEDSVRKYGAKLLIIDNLMMLDLGGSDDAKNERQTECVTRLIKFAMKYSVAVVLVAHPRKTPAGEELNMYDVAGSSNIINLAHRAIGLRRINQEKEHSAYNVKVTILKDRLRGMANKEINMYYDMASRRFYTNEEEYNHQYGWDNGHYDALPYPHSDEDEIFGEEK